MTEGTKNVVAGFALLLAMVIGTVLVISALVLDTANGDEGTPAPGEENCTKIYTHYSWTGGKRAATDPPTEVPPSANWQQNTSSEPHTNNPNVLWYDGSVHSLPDSQGFAALFYLDTQLDCPEEEDPDPIDYCDTVDGVQDESFNCPPAEPPAKPVRSTVCFGNDLKVTVTYADGSEEVTWHTNHKLCKAPSTGPKPSSPKSSPTPAAIGTPKQQSSIVRSTVVVKEEGM